MKTYTAAEGVTLPGGHGGHHTEKHCEPMPVVMDAATEHWP